MLLRQGNKGHNRIPVLGCRKSREGVAMAGMPGHPIGWGHRPDAAARLQREKPCAGIGCCIAWCFPALPVRGFPPSPVNLAGFWPRAVVTLGNGTRAHVAGLSRGSGCIRAHQGVTAAPT